MSEDATRCLIYIAPMIKKKAEECRRWKKRAVEAESRLSSARLLQAASSSSESDRKQQATGGDGRRRSSAVDDDDTASSLAPDSSLSLQVRVVT